MQALLGPGAAGGPVTFGIAVVVTVLQVLFSGIFGGSGVNSATQTALNKLRDQLTTAVDLVKRFAWSIARTAVAVLYAVYSLLEDLVKKLLQAVRDLGKVIQDVYNKVIVPALNALQKIRAMLNDIYNNWLRPIILAIQKVRQFLSILRAFGIKWAGDLDDRLARIEGKITGPFLWLVQQLNGYGSWLNLILTTRATIQKIIFKRTLLENMGSLTALVWGSQTKPGGISASNNGRTAYTPKTLAQCKADMTAYAQYNVGPLADDARAAQALFQTFTAGL